MTLILKNAHIDQLIPYLNIHIQHEYFHKQNINYTIYDDIDIFSSPKYQRYYIYIRRKLLICFKA